MSRNEKILRLSGDLLIVLFITVADQITKFLAVSELKPIYTYPIIKDVLHLTYLENTGAAFGILKNARWIFMILTTAVVIALALFIVLRRDKISGLLTVGLCFVIGGGIGNMIDRVFNGYVVDFVDFRLINFAIFNVADSFVTVGVILIVIDVLFGKGRSLLVSDEKKADTCKSGDDVDKETEKDHEDISD